MSEFNTIIYSVEENIAVITINRPKFLNALNSEVLKELSEAIDLIENDPQVRVVIVTGSRRKSFCSRS